MARLLYTVIHRPDMKAKPLRGLGDAVAVVAQPIARAIDRVAGTNVAGCGGCKQRQDTLNRWVPFDGQPPPQG